MKHLLHALSFLVPLFALDGCASGPTPAPTASFATTKPPTFIVSGFTCCNSSILSPSTFGSLRVATTGLALWLTDRYHLSQSEIAAVLGTAMRYEIAEVVDPQINIVATIRKDMLAKIHP